MAGKFVLRNPGVYIGKIKNWYRGVSQNGSAYIEFVVFVTERETEEGEREKLETPFSVPVTRYMTPGALPITAADLAYLGYTDGDPAKLDRDHPQAFNFRDKEVYVRCDHDEYQGKTREKWNLQRRKRPATAEERKRIDSTLAEGFAAEMARLRGDQPAEGPDPFGSPAEEFSGAGRF